MSRRPENLGGTTRDDDLRLEPVHGANQTNELHADHRHGTDGAVSTDRPIDVTDRTHGDHMAGGRRLTHGYGNGTAIAAFVLGMFSLNYALTGVLGPIAVIVGLVALGMGIKGMANARRMDGHHRGLAISGLLLGGLATLLSIAAIIGGVALFNSAQNNVDQGDLQQRIDDLERQVQDLTS